MLAQQIGRWVGPTWGAVRRYSIQRHVANLISVPQGGCIREGSPTMQLRPEYHHDGSLRWNSLSLPMLKKGLICAILQLDGPFPLKKLDRACRLTRISWQSAIGCRSFDSMAAPEAGKIE
jgi:hypothetical protein